MNCEFFKYLIASPMFDNFLELDMKFISDIMSGPCPAKTASTGGTIASEGVALDVVSMEALAPVPTILRSPRSKPTLVREVPKPKKDKKNKPMPVHKSSRKHAATQAQKKEKLSAKDKVKVVHLEDEEGIKDIETKGVDSISKLPDYIPLRKGKVKVPKDPYA